MCVRENVCIYMPVCMCVCLCVCACVCVCVCVCVCAYFQKVISLSQKEKHCIFVVSTDNSFYDTRSVRYGLKDSL